MLKIGSWPFYAASHVIGLAMYQQIMTDCVNERLFQTKEEDLPFPFNVHVNVNVN